MWITLFSKTKFTSWNPLQNTSQIKALTGIFLHTCHEYKYKAPKVTNHVSISSNISSTYLSELKASDCNKVGFGSNMELLCIQQIWHFLLACLLAGNLWWICFNDFNLLQIQHIKYGRKHEVHQLSHFHLFRWYNRCLMQRVNVTITRIIKVKKLKKVMIRRVPQTS